MSVSFCGVRIPRQRAHVHKADRSPRSAARSRWGQQAMTDAGDKGSSPVHTRRESCSAAGVSGGTDVRRRDALRHPQPAPRGGGHARQHDSGARRGHEVRVGPGKRDPSPTGGDQGAIRPQAVDRAPRMPRIPQVAKASQTIAGGDSAQCGSARGGTHQHSVPRRPKPGACCARICGHFRPPPNCGGISAHTPAAPLHCVPARSQGGDVPSGGWMPRHPPSCE